MSKIRSQQQTSAEKDDDDDLISRLPDEIVVEIINRLGNLIEAARTSVLSTRWRDLWTFSNNLNLDPPKNICKSLEEIRESRPNYINWVHKVLKLHRASTINIFKIHYDLYHPHTDVLTNWIHSAISNRGRIRHFELRLNLQGAGKHPKFIFPQECYDILRSPDHDRGLSFISSLKSLSLTDVNISGEILHFFVYKCPLLERLHVAHSCAPEFALRIVGPSIRLKYIEFDCCFSIREVEISVPSLLSFKFYGSDIISLKVGNVPQLVDVSIGGNCTARLKNYIEPMINYLPQLHTLEFRLLLYSHPTDDSEFPFCELPNLRHLIFWVGGNDDKSLLGLTRMIEACPCLEKFTLKLVHFGRNDDRRRKIKEFPRCAVHQHRHLKVVEFIGFAGRPLDLELAFYFLENAVMLEKMIVNPIFPFSLGCHFELNDTKKKEAARINAQQYLQEKIPRGVEFVIS